MTLAQGYTLITGATRGIGRAIADLLAARGEPVMGIARSGDAGFPGPLLQADLLDAAQRREVLREAASHGVLRLVNNAGFNQMQPLGEITDAATSAILELNIAVAIDAAQAVLPGMTEAGAGRIVNIASRSLLARPGGSVYSAAKAAMVGLTRSWALELATRGITVNCVAPGPVATEMFQRNNPPELARSRALVEAIPVARLGTPEEIAHAVDYFLAPHAAYTTGQTLFVCGGASISQIKL
ncbi:SDR family oxidoreductase [Bordetella bronchiseptica]|uniref:SDR family oxidoreductase n=1 Tax=Bordetella bronchiseptica TaxID=518 RepID=UPI00028AFCC4|nr:SDR family oxidoreductase [Bordetella bronchiseptica]KCV33537.1 NAD(P)H-binding protein, PF13460 family [Bordetella bronchiseptica 00-P-2730]KDD64530.1 NAD(P)H-binding protein, PF13460 family [Bordetella bronchiseptica OSU553]AUL16547.1 short-chain dehydrogenase [Bordetella bronchiseptica]AWP59774.1 short-chain dehydrogenase [Bordetella bronchiseptica]AWQ06425.1 short-chain dehydrogenase [Bordetella bronchiseptica]